MRSPFLVALLAAAFVSAAADANADGTDATDVTQRLDSPLSAGSGLTLSASQAKQTLALGLGWQLTGSLWMQLLISGQAAQNNGQTAESTTLFSTTSGVSAGVSAKLGIGYSSFQHRTFADSQFLKGCDEMQATIVSDQGKACIESTITLAKKLDLPTEKITAAQREAERLAVEQLTAAQRAAEEHLSAATAAQVKAAQTKAAQAPCLAGTRALLKVASAPAGAESSRPLWTESLRRLLEDLDASINAHDAVAAVETIKAGIGSGEESGGSTSSGGARTPTTKQFKSCNEMGQNPKYKSYYDDHVGRWLRPQWDFKISLNALGQTQSVAYQPVDATGAPASGGTKTYVPLLPGGSLDVLLYRAAFVGGLQFGYTRSVNPHYQQVCTVVTGNGVTANDCSQATLAKPSTSNTAFLSVALAVNPLASIGNLVLGAELLGQASTNDMPPKTGPATSVFGSDTWTYTASLPFFIANADAPWGLRAGLSPQLTVPTQSGKDTSLSILIFVGTRFGSPSGGN